MNPNVEILKDIFVNKFGIIYLIMGILYFIIEQKNAYIKFIIQIKIKMFYCKSNKIKYLVNRLNKAFFKNKES